MAKTQSAGEFSQWLRGAAAILGSEKGEADVPCGSCTTCCRASMFIHIEPEETQTIARIPRKLLFAAPGFPTGHVLMGYNEQGHCPMFVEGKCSIYEDRPQTCRSYDCRIYAATGVTADHEEIAERVKQWRFRYGSDEAREERATLKRAAAFLRENRDLFPYGSLPSNPAPLAALAVQVYKLFADAKRSDAEIAEAVLSELVVAAED
ncbi:MAG: YkgJ family cysteine cluster protein [Bryobacteraceae bacterium]